MNDQTRKEILKALAYGKTHDEIKAAMNVSDEAINSITAAEIAAKRDELKGMGFIK